MDEEVAIDCLLHQDCLNIPDVCPNCGRDVHCSPNWKHLIWCYHCRKCTDTHGRWTQSTFAGTFFMAGCHALLHFSACLSVGQQTHRCRSTLGGRWQQQWIGCALHSSWWVRWSLTTTPKTSRWEGLVLRCRLMSPSLSDGSTTEVTGWMECGCLAGQRRLQSANASWCVHPTGQGRRCCSASKAHAPLIHHCE